MNPGLNQDQCSSLPFKHIRFKIVKKFKNHTLSEYLNVLSKREPVPGGGSVAALTAASASGLLTMVANYSVGCSKSKVVERRIAKIVIETGKLKERFLELVDLDAQAYLNVVKARKGTARDKKAANRAAAAVPKEICKLAYKSVDHAKYLAANGNPYLVSDVEIAAELLLASFKSALVLVDANQ